MRQSEPVDTRLALEIAPLCRSICDRGRVRRLEPDEVLIHQGTKPMFVGMVLSGVLRLQRLHEDGTRRVLGFLFPGYLFGSPGREVCTASGVEAAKAARVACLDHRTFLALIEADRRFHRAFSIAKLAELDAAYELSFLLGIQRREARVAAYLHGLIERGIRENTPSSRRTIDFSVSRRDVAAYLAIAVETLCRSLHALELAGAIRLIDAKRFEIVDEDLLRRIADYP